MNISPITGASLTLDVKHAIRKLFQAYLDVYSAFNPGTLKIRRVVGLSPSPQFTPYSELAISSSSATNWSARNRASSLVSCGLPTLHNKVPKSLLGQVKADLDALDPDALAMAMAMAPGLCRTNAFIAHTLETTTKNPLGQVTLTQALALTPLVWVSLVAPGSKHPRNLKANLLVD